MKRPVDKRRKSKDSPTVSKQQFIESYVAASRLKYKLAPGEFGPVDAAELIEEVAAGRNGLSPTLKQVAMLHGAKPGRVGNFLRGLR